MVPFGRWRTTDDCWLRRDTRDAKWTDPLPKVDFVGQVQFIQRILSIAA
jgi:hypothetical protein